MSNERRGAPLRLFAAGSLRRAGTEILARFEAIHGVRVEVRFGPAGLLRAAIEAGAAVDVFASANTAHPQALYAAGRFGRPVVFAANPMTIVARRGILTPGDDPIARMLDPTVVVGTSTAGADASGDYAQWVFDRIEAIRPGAGEAIRRRARALVGGPTTAEVPAGRQSSEWLIATGQADLVLAYRSGAVAVADDPGLIVVDLPAAVAVTADYAVTVARGADRWAEALAAFLCGDEAAAILGRCGLLPPRPIDPTASGV
jgi:molybdate transport system substrate-binding protein